MGALAGAVAVAVVVLPGCEAAGEPPLGFDDPADTATTADPAGDGTASPEPVGDPSTPPEDDQDWAIEVGTEPPEAPADLAVYDAYLAYWRADFTAVNIPDPAHQPFLDAAIDPQRQRIVAVAERLAADGLRTVGTLRIEPLVVSVDGPAAAIQDCMDGRDTYDVDAAGDEAPDSRGTLIPVVVQLTLTGPDWAVADVQESDHDCG